MMKLRTYEAADPAAREGSAEHSLEVELFEQHELPLFLADMAEYYLGESDTLSACAAINRLGAGECTPLGNELWGKGSTPVEVAKMLYDYCNAVPDAPVVARRAQNAAAMLRRRLRTSQGESL